MTAPTGLYVHLPFCVSRCGYCTFAVTTDRRPMDRYLKALEAELPLSMPVQGTPLETLYLGGGTPSYLPPGRLSGLLAAVRRRHPLAAGAEVTSEANPDDVGPGLLEEWAAAGVNRISIGVQSFVDRELAVLDRRHDAATARRAVAAALEHGPFQVNVDLILAVPGQAPESLRRTLDELIALAPHHVSVYLLEMDKPHRLRRLWERCPEAFPDEEAAAAAYLTVHDRLTAAGYHHYEVSNFARAGCRSAHNLRYWRCRPVHALGLAAHGQEPGRRWANLGTLDGYLAAVERGERPVAWERRLGAAERRAETALLGLRLAEGISARLARSLAAQRPEFGDRLEAFLDLGLAVEEGDRIRLTPRGWLVSNELLSGLV